MSYNQSYNKNKKKRPLTPKSMPPAGDEHANLKTRPPTTNARGKGKHKALLETQHRLTTPLHTSRYSARFAQSRGRSICSVRPMSARAITTYNFVRVLGIRI